MTDPINVIVVTSPGCHFCDDALSLLGELAETYPLRRENVPLSSEVGRALLVRHRVPFPPILMIDGEFFGYGRISRRKLEAHLVSMTAGERAG
ncbi:MAG TPA: glutaredoxin [Acidimicrobiia bacterium]|nr:glutaredoxin [Acidimicrobiia bacterium]